MTDRQLDEILKSRLPGHESPVPEDMWERIIRKKDKDRKGFFFFFSLFGLFILGFGIAGILLFNVNKKGVPKEEKHAQNSKAISNSDTVKSVGPGNELQINPSGSHEAAFGKASTVMNTVSRKDYRKNGKSTQYSNMGIPEMTSKQQNKSSGLGEAQSMKDTSTRLVEGDVNLESSKLSNQKATPILSSTSTPNHTDTSKTATVKKSDSTKKNTGNKWSLDLYASPDYPIDYADDFVKSKLSYTVGLRINRSFGKRFSGKIGIQFSQLNYILGDSGQMAGASHLKSLDLPVLAGYSWGNETLGMTVNAGVLFNLYTWPDAASTSYFKTNTGLSLYLGFNFSKHINQRIDIFSEPYYRYRLSSMTNSTVDYLKFIDVAGLSFGVRYHFKK
jgi:hypothetical protein